MTEKVDAQAKGSEADEHAGHGPHGKDEGLKQADVDRMLRAREGKPKTAAQGFERPEPLTLAELRAAKRAALFG